METGRFRVQTAGGGGYSGEARRKITRGFGGKPVAFASLCLFTSLVTGKGKEQEVYLLFTNWNPGGIGALKLVNLAD